MEKYSQGRDEPERNIDRFVEATGQLWKGLSESEADLLGVTYEHMGMDNDHFGQYFTPHNLSEMMAESLFGDEVEEKQEPITIADPACGSGRLLLKTAQQLPDDTSAWYFGQDKDPVCAKMTALNFTYYNMDGMAVYGDSLKAEMDRVWSVRGSPMGAEIRELEEDEFPAIYDQMFDSSDPGVTSDRGGRDVQNLESTELDDFL